MIEFAFVFHFVPEGHAIDTQALRACICLAKSSTSNRPVVLTEKPGSFGQLFDTTNG
jgi:hypothetical protein